MDYTIKSFNGFGELFKRKDAVDVLIKRYDEIVKNVAAMCSKDGGAVFLYADLELLLGSYQIHDDETVETYREILRSLMNGYLTKLKFPDVFGPLSSPPNYIARAMIIEKISPNALLSKIKEPFHALDPSEVEIINKLSNELIK